MHDRFDRLYVVSDLHLGGRSDAEVFDSSEELGALIRWTAKAAVSEDVGFVIAGDIVDFLAFHEATYFNADKAEVWLESLMKKPVGVVFDALKELTEVERARLILLIGNHDIELALPTVQSKLLSMVAGSPAARSRVTMSLDGTGYSCLVGGRRVLCLHGNERDSWNVIDHPALRRRVRDVKRGHVPAPWEPNAGTTLVIDVMNPIKRMLPFVDLLQPETNAVPNVLLALDKERRGLGIGEAVRKSVDIIRRKLGDRWRIQRDTLGSVDIGRYRDDFDALESSPEDDPYELERRREDLYDSVEDAYARKLRPIELAGRPGRTLGVLHTVAAALHIGVQGNLREALKDVLRKEEEKSYSIAAPDDTFHTLNQWVGADIDVLIAGHTHIEKHLPRVEGSKTQVYLNTGTWIRLIQMRDEFLTAENFKDFVDKLVSRSMADLDDAEVANHKLVTRRRTVACVEADSRTKKVTVGLRRVRDEATQDKLFEERPPFEPWYLDSDPGRQA
jgi:UDP-2,3-diacylglucosamine pyrophosphatase LpxH